MSASPPRDSNGIPGYLVVLAAFSVLVFLAALGFGLVAFDIVDLGRDDNSPAPTVVVDGEALQNSGFTIRESRVVNRKYEIDVNVSVTNTGDELLKNSTMFVQCLDGGNVSNSQLITQIQPDQTIQFEMTLYGTGEPKCTSPIVAFDTP
ncbi:MAG: hypothetical protein M9934_14465 [Thermomicrobiales bacterium]|nr:hypothetical protein [Thermomicrobiales bacterium]